MKSVLAVLIILLLGASSQLPATSAVPGPGSRPESAEDAALTLSPAAIAEGNAYWMKLGVTPPKGGFMVARPWSPPWSGRSLIVPAPWFEQAFHSAKNDAKSKTPMPIDAKALRKDLPILRLVLEKNYSGWETAARRGWNWNEWFQRWDRMLASYGGKSIADRQAFAPWFAYEDFQIDSHSGPEVPSRFGNIIISRSAMLSDAPRAACTSLRLTGSIQHPLSADDKAHRQAVIQIRGQPPPVFTARHSHGAMTAASTTQRARQRRRARHQPPTPAAADAAHRVEPPGQHLRGQQRRVARAVQFGPMRELLMHLRQPAQTRRISASGTVESIPTTRTARRSAFAVQPQQRQTQPRTAPPGRYQHIRCACAPPLGHQRARGAGARIAFFHARRGIVAQHVSILSISVTQS